MADTPFPENEAGINLLLQSLAVSLAPFKPILPVVQEDIDFIIAAAANFQYLINTTPLVSDAKETFTKFKDAYFNGAVTNSAPAVPTFPAINVPNPATVGLITETKAIIKRIKAAPGYTVVIGEALGLVDTGPAPFNANDLNAELKIVAKPGNIVEIAFSKQGQDAMQVEFKRKSETVWGLAGVYTSTPGTHTAPSVPPEDPESRQYRDILLKKNVPIGNVSPIYTVVTIP